MSQGPVGPNGGVKQRRKWFTIGWRSREFDLAEAQELTVAIRGATLKHASQCSRARRHEMSKIAVLTKVSGNLALIAPDGGREHSGSARMV